MGKNWQAHTLTEFIKNSNGKVQKIAEIGIWKGETVKKVLRQCHDIISQYLGNRPMGSFSVCS